MFRLTKLTAIAGMLAVSSLGSVALVSGVASASAPTVACTTAKIAITGSGTLSGCNDTKNTGGSGKLVTNTSKHTGVITWNKTGTTTLKFTEKSVTNTKCSPKTKGSMQFTEVSTTTGGTGVAVKSIPKGQVATETICLISGKVSVAPGSKFRDLDR